MKIPAKYADRVSSTDKDEDGYWIWLKFPWVDGFAFLMRVARLIGDLPF